MSCSSDKVPWDPDTPFHGGAALQSSFDAMPHYVRAIFMWAGRMAHVYSVLDTIPRRGKKRVGLGVNYPLETELKSEEQPDGDSPRGDMSRLFVTSWVRRKIP